MPKPPAPTQLVRTVSMDNVDLGWNWGPGSLNQDQIDRVQFELQYKRAKVSRWTEIGNFDPRKKSHRLENLLAGSYDVRLRSSLTGKNGGYSNWITNNWTIASDVDLDAGVVFDRLVENVAGFQYLGAIQFPDGLDGYPIEYVNSNATEAGFTTSIRYIRLQRNVSNFRMELTMTMNSATRWIRGNRFYYAPNYITVRIHNAAFTSHLSSGSIWMRDTSRTLVSGITYRFSVSRQQDLISGRRLWFLSDMRRQPGTGSITSLFQRSYKFESLRLSGGYTVPKTTTARISNITVGNPVITSLQSAYASEHRSGRYGKFFRFTLASKTTINIEMISGQFDPYMFLLSGHGTGGSVLYENDDESDNSTNSRFRSLSLSAGNYTLECTSFGAAETGDFRVFISEA